MAKAENRPVIALACTVCKERTYSTRKNKKKVERKLELKKFDPVTRKREVFKEVKK